MPAGRKEIITRWVKHEQLEVVLDWLVKELGKGSQAYFISPLIEESEALDLKNALALKEGSRPSLDSEHAFLFFMGR